MIRSLTIPLLAPLLALTAAAAPPAAELASPTPVFVPERFFSGRTESVGKLKAIMQGTSNVRVHSVGKMDRGTLVIDQVVEREGAPTEKRQWRITKNANGRYAGTLSDAVGPLSGDVSGNRLYLKYKLRKGGVSVEQWVYLQNDGRTALNHMILRKLGVQVGTFEETIRRVD